ncbi:MAG: translation initiation factor IF-2 N-terminal domain-containing protein, partial [Candidatus Methylomirabilales bacterium]
MSKTRVDELAKDLGLSNQEVIERLVRAMARIALSKEEISKKKDPKKIRREKPSRKAKRAKRIRKSAKVSPVPDPHVVSEPTVAAPASIPGAAPERKPLAAEEEHDGHRFFLLQTEWSNKPEPAPAPPKPEAPTEPPRDPEPSHVDVRQPETPVMEEPAPVREGPVPVAPSIPALTTSPTVEESVSPSAPKGITIPEMITVKELSEKLATSPSEIIKTLMKMGITATGNQNLNPELVKHVATEFGYTVEVTPFEEMGEFVGEVGDQIELAPSEPVPGREPERRSPPGEENPPPTAKMVEISEMVTLKELSKKVETGPSEIIKALMKMGITATLDQNLNPELVKHVATEFGFNVKVTPFEEVEQHSGASRVGLAGIPWLELSAAMRARGAHISEVGLPSIDTTSHATGSTASSYVLRNKLWFLGGAIVTMVLLTLAVPRMKGTRSPEATPPVVDEGQRVAAISFTKASSSTMGDPRTYRQDIKPLIGVYCDKCHGLKGVAASVSLERYRDVIE